MNHTEFYSTINKFINSEHEEFRTLCAIPQNEEICTNDYLMTMIYKLRIAKMTNKVMQFYKPETLSWKSYYETILFLVKNINQPWLVNALAKSGKYFELELLGHIDRTKELTQKDLDDAARNNQVEFVKRVYETTGMLPDINVVIELQGLSNIPMMQYFEEIDHLPDVDSFIKELKKEIPSPKIIEFYTDINKGLEDEYSEMAFDYAIIHQDELLLKNLFRFFAASKDTLMEIYNRVIDTNNPRLIAILLTGVFQRMEKSNTKENNELIELLILNDRLQLTTLFEHLLRTGRQFTLDNMISRAILVRNNINLLKWFYSKGLKSDYIRKNYANIMKDRQITREMKNTITELLK